MTSERFSGVLAPVITPFNRDLAPDGSRFVQHCRWLIKQGVGLAVFGTNSEANSLSICEKIALLDQLSAAAVDPAMMMPGTGCCALSDCVRLTAHAVALGCGGVLMLPPFYYKGVSDEGLFRYYSEVIERVASDDLRIYLYHIPPISQVPLSIPLIDRLVTAYPNNIAGIKDSSGEWENTRSLNQQQWPNFQVFCGSESFLLQHMHHGGAGCISATANVNGAAIHALYASWQSAEAPLQQEQLNTIRSIFQAFPMISALKAATSLHSDDPDWLRVRPPLTELESGQLNDLQARLTAAGFDMPDLAAS